MEHSVRREGTTAIISLKGRLTFKYHKEYQKLLDDIMVDQNAKRLEFDLNEVEFMDSAGLGVLLIARQRADKLNAEIVLKRPSTDLKRILTVAQFDRMFTIED